MRKLGLVALAIAMSMGVPAEAGKRDWYVGIEGGIEFDGWGKGDTGWAGLATLGKEITEHVSFEAELGYRSTTNVWWPIDISQTSLMVNAVYDAQLTKEIGIELGIGAGVDRINFDYWFADFEETEYAGQFKAGLTFALTEETDLVASYRYVEMLSDSPVNNSTLTIGLRFAL